MDFAFSPASPLEGVLLISAFLAPILFLSLKRYFLSILSVAAVGFSLVMLHMYHAPFDLTMSEIKVFLSATQLLNACAALLVFSKIFKKKAFIPIQTTEIVEEAMEEELNKIEIKEISDLLKSKGIIKENMISKEEKAKSVL